MNKVLDVSRYVINYSNKKNYGVSNLKLQKLLYFIQVYFIKDINEPCFEEAIEAWDFGPVVPEVYQEFKQFGSTDIPSVYSYYEFDYDNPWESKKKNFDEDCIKKKDRRIINLVIDKLADYSATDLVRITHNQRPWIDAYKSYSNNEITIKSIEEYFSEKQK